MIDAFDTIQRNVDLLTRPVVPEYGFIPHHSRLLPNLEAVKESMELLKGILFPGFLGETGSNPHTQTYHVGTGLERLYGLLREQIERCSEFFEEGALPQSAGDLALAFIDQLPEIKRLLCTDVKAIFEGDATVKFYEEVIYCYPAVLAMIHYRVAHTLLKLGIPVIPRIITELAHSATGIDIHPAARIDEYFSIGHGIGVVIGETCIIGKHVRLYQGVTLGARNNMLDEYAVSLDEPRHPVLEDHVIIYSNTTLLGRVTIGHHTIIGGNIWQTTSVAPYSRVTQQKSVETTFVDGLGI